MKFLQIGQEVYVTVPRDVPFAGYIVGAPFVYVGRFFQRVRIKGTEAVIACPVEHMEAIEAVEGNVVIGPWAPKPALLNPSVVASL